MGSVPGMVQRLRRRSGQAIGIDFAIAFIVFLVTVVVGFAYTNSVLATSSPFSENVQRSAMDASDRFSDMNEWTVHRLPVTIGTSYSEQRYPVEVLYTFPEDVDPNSTTALHDGDPLRSQTDLGLNETTFYANLSADRQHFDVVHTRDTDLDGLNTTEGIYRDGSEVWNGDINATIGSDGMDALSIDSQPLLEGSDIIEGSGSVFHTEGPLRHTATFNGTGKMYMRMFSDDNRIRLRQDGGPEPSTYTLDLDDGFDEVYLANYSGDSQTNSTDSSGTIYSGRADIADFHNTGGTTHSLGVMNDGMEITVENSSGDLTAEVTVQDSDAESLVLPHTGEQDQIQPQIDLFFDPPRMRALPVDREQGLSLRSIEQYGPTTVESLRNDLGLGDLGYNLTVQGYTSVGEEPPGSSEVAVIDTPAIVLGRFGNTTLTDLRVSIWL